jgi:argininosuccinate lyase
MAIKKTSKPAKKSATTKATGKSANKMWGGHFESGPSEIMAEINQSISFDWVLYKQDIKGSTAHAKMLAKTGILKKAEVDKIIKGLQQVEKEIDSGKFTFKKELEDIHMNVENRLKEIIGDVAGKLHTARSRNDQVATDFKLFTRDFIDELTTHLGNLQKAVIKRAKENVETIMPGFTHLQTAQPVTFAHHLLAYNEMLKRDLSRLKDCRKRLNECPLGAAALAGTSYPIDRHFTAKELGFDAPTNNSLDTVSDRDFALELVSALNILAIHLSRLSEEIIIWLTDGFKFIKLSDKFTTGSSIMPQKRNPDAAELIRGKTGRILGSLTSLSVMLKGLPLAYSKDMQEDKEATFDAMRNISLCVKAMQGMIEDLEVSKPNMYAASQKGYSTATDLADWLVKTHGIPFRECHHITGRVVKLAESKGCRLDELSLKELQSVEPRISKAAMEVLKVENSVKSRTSFGGTSPLKVKGQLK